MLESFEPNIRSVQLIPSDQGRFEFYVDDHLAYSKLQTSRHATAGEILELFKSYIQER